MRNKTLIWWTSSTGKIELKIRHYQAEFISHSGDCEDDVIFISLFPEIKKQLDEINKDVLIEVLLDYGVWNTEQLQDHKENLIRLLWLASGDIVDYDKKQLKDNIISV